MKEPGKNRAQLTGNSPEIKRKKTLPLYELAYACCSTGACRSVRHWPVEHPQDGLLQLDGEADTDIPVDLIGFSGRGVSVVMSAEHPIRQGGQGLLITQAHGAGCSYHRVTCCWHHLDPENHHRQCAGLRFEAGSPD